MKVKKRNIITKAILLFSFILIFIGGYLYTTEEKKYESTEGNEIVYNPPPGNIKIDDTTSKEGNIDSQTEDKNSNNEQS